MYRAKGITSLSLVIFTCTSLPTASFWNLWNVWNALTASFVCVREREIERKCMSVSECEWVSVWVWERDSLRVKVHECVRVSVCVCVRVRERNREKVCTCMQVSVCVLYSDLNSLSSHFPNMLTVFIVWTRLLATPVGLSHFPGSDNSLSPNWTKTTPHLYTSSSHVYACSYIYILHNRCWC